MSTPSESPSGTDTSVFVRPAVAADIDAVAAIWRAGWREAHLGHVPDELVAVRTPESFRTRAADRTPVTWVAVADGEVAGFVMVIGDELEQLYVAANHRGGRIARALLRESERIAAGAGHSQIWLAVVAGNARARRFYDRNGWTDDGPFDYLAGSSGGPVTVPAHRYVKRTGQ